MGDQYNWDRNVQPAVRRILDANLDRAREGLRIIEELSLIHISEPTRPY